MSKQSAQLFWVDALCDLAAREKMAARVQRKAPNGRLVLYVLPCTLAQIGSIDGPAAARSKYKAFITALDQTEQLGFKDPREVDLSMALDALRCSDASRTIRALANVNNPASEIDILAIKTPYLAKSQTAVDEDKQERVVA